MKTLFLIFASFAVAQTTFTNGIAPPSVTVSGLPTASSNTGRLFWVSDGANDGDCVTGGAARKVLCGSNGTTWIAQTQGGSPNTKFSVHDVGGDDTYAASSLGGCPAALIDGVTTVELVVDTTNTNDAFLDFCGLGSLEISEDASGTNLTSSVLVVGRVYPLVYDDQATDVWRVTLPGAGGGGAISHSENRSMILCKDDGTGILNATDISGVFNICSGSGGYGGYIEFHNAGTDTIQMNSFLPSTWTGNITLSFIYTSTTTVTSPAFSVATWCPGNGASHTPSFGTPDAVSLSGTADTIHVTTSGTLAVVGCVAGEPIQYKIVRTDTNTGNIRLHQIVTNWTY
jgi:hypothetical protein